MESSQIQHIFIIGLLLAAAFYSVASTGVSALNAILGQHYPSLAFAQEELRIPDTNTDYANITATTTTNNFTEGTTAGIIASLQLAPNRPAPEWVTAGYWELESDMPLFGSTNQTEPTVMNFYAIVEMTRLADGTFRHDHRFYDFRQSDILFTTENTTTIIGTMTVVTEESITENVPTYITLQNNLISIFVDPEATQNHFGPTPITGIILASEHLQEIADVLAPISGEGSGATRGSVGSDPPSLQGNTTSPMTIDTRGNATGR
jgi:hypothetical protein